MELGKAKELSPTKMGRSTKAHGRMTRSTALLKDRALAPSLLDKSTEAHSRTTHGEGVQTMSGGGRYSGTYRQDAWWVYLRELMEFKERQVGT
jgi:hypothetical protein